jgi:acetyl-CoA carboxylase carboxyltransferase component
MVSPATVSVTAPFAGVVVALPHGADGHVGAGTAVAVLEAMKMEHEVLAEFDGIVVEIAVAVGDSVEEDQLLLVLERGGSGAETATQPAHAERQLRELIPEQRKRAYQVRTVVRMLFDEGSVLELRDGFGAGMLTALARVDGRPLGVIANDPTHLGGAIDADAADKAARFMQLCDAFELPVLCLCDTPGFMVGPAAERTATVRHFARMFLGGASMTVPVGTIVLRKGYGLGAQAMATGGFKSPMFTVAWPTSEFGGMGLEGAVRLGMRRELEAIEDHEERERVFQATVAAAYGEIDDVIDPADSRRWIATLFDDNASAWQRRDGKKRPNVDAW